MRDVFDEGALKLELETVDAFEPGVSEHARFRTR